ncbi:valine--tRNA ligase [bacterium]|nr:valine--tRNA ligase [bacterium]
MALSKTYNPSEVEGKIYEKWEKSGFFKGKVNLNKKPYSIVIPPPNVTGMLTMGHILNNTIQDILIRFHRMKGYETCWVPGTDHASIATEAKVTQMLSEQGIDKFQIGREKFLEHAYVWKEKYGGIIIKQLRSLGTSCDWERERFTMDEKYYQAVVDVFVDLYDEGKIYKGFRMVNWCPVSKSAISDEEVIFQEVQGKLYYLKYPVKGSDEFITVATTRPETMLGDTGIAINPDDERHKHLIGKTVVLPIVNREIKIIADFHVQAEFGTGFVKVTPAHDPNDYEIGKRHNLEFINIFNEDATLNSNVPEEFVGLERYKARKLVVKKFEELGLLAKIEDYTHKVGYSERGKVPIEPYISEQWFMKMEELVKPAIEAVKNEEIHFYPKHWEKTYFHWMENIKDWCISRQLWWGHRIPVWTCKQTNEVKAFKFNPNENPETKKQGTWEQDSDVLDTWSSSWLWSFAVWETEEELKYFHPTNALVTGPDIIFFWVARMIIAAKHFHSEIPFRDVYFTGMILDEQGRKMSKSLGNSPNPLDVIAEYGADALRFTITRLSPLGQSILYSNEKCELGRTFANKIWNAARFLLMQREKFENLQSSDFQPTKLEDRWIFSRLHKTISQVENFIGEFNFVEAVKCCYEFIWNDFCDWYIEMIKSRLYDENAGKEALALAIEVFDSAMKLLHPFMPFVTEEIWQNIRKREETEAIMVSEFPVFDKNFVSAEVENSVETLKSVIATIRNIRGNYKIPPSQAIDVILKTNLQTLRNNENYLKSLAKINNLTFVENAAKNEHFASAFAGNIEVLVSLEGLIDFEKEKEKARQEIERLEKQLEGVKLKLSNEKFISSAPENIVENERKKLLDWAEKIAKLRVNL